MGDVVILDSMRPHVTITDHARRVHVLPVATFTAIARGECSVDCLDDRDAILRVLVAEWLDHIGLHSAEQLREMDE